MMASHGRRGVKALYFAAPLSKLLVNVLLNLLLNTYWLSILQGKAIYAFVPLRIYKNLGAWPIEAAVLVLIAVFLTKNKRRLLH